MDSPSLISLVTRSLSANTPHEIFALLLEALAPRLVDASAVRLIVPEYDWPSWLICDWRAGKPPRFETQPRVIDGEAHAATIPVGWQTAVVPLASPENEHASPAEAYLAADVESLSLSEDERDLLAALIGHARQLEHRLRTEKLEAMAEFAAGAGHEINNPIATISGRVQLLLQAEQDPDRRASLVTIGAQAHRVRDMIGDAMLFGRPPAPQRARCVIADEVDAVLDAMREILTAQQLSVAGERDGSCSAWADPTQVRVVISELLRNAMTASPPDSVITIDVAPSSVKAGDPPGCVLTVSDTGRGMSVTDAVHAFDPFFSGRQAGRGLGFGLSKCWRIVTLHGGSIACRSSAQGTYFRVCWPSLGCNG